MVVGVAPEREEEKEEGGKEEGKHGTKLLRSALLRGQAVVVAVGGRRKGQKAACGVANTKKARWTRELEMRAGVRQRGWAAPLDNWLTGAAMNSRAGEQEGFRVEKGSCDAVFQM